MGEKLSIVPINKGTKTDRLAFNIDNDSFPLLVNAYQWRGRVKRKRGNTLLNRLQRHFDSTISSYGSTTSFTLDGSGQGNLLTAFSLAANSNIIPGSVAFTDSTASINYTDPAMDGTLSPSGTINYATGAIDLGGGSAGDTINTVSFNYYPDLPVMGLEDLVLNANEFPGNLAFDTTKSYNITTANPYPIYDVSFYKNPTTVGGSYTPKTTPTPLQWNGQDYQQFWTTNYENALWATNGINVPFTTASIGMQFKPIVSVTVTSGGPPAQATLNIVGHGLVTGDFIFVNEVVTTTGINFQTGYVINPPIDANNVHVEFLDATIASNGTGGIAQYLTNNADASKDCLRWYDGDPTNGDATSPVLDGHNGWVNFSPPISESSFPINDLPSAQYYLVGARVVVPFKDRLLFFGVVVQSSTTGPFYLQDTIVYSQNGTPYYTASFTGAVDSPATQFTPILVPNNQTARPSVYFADLTGFGGNFSAGIAQPIISVNNNEDVLIVGFTNKQARFVYTGSDIIPFNLFIINSEYGTGSTFSTTTLDRGVISVGADGIVITAQISCQRIDLDIPDQIFEFNLLNNGAERVCTQRDFINEWIYFSFPSNEESVVFPNQTLLYNYRDDSWGLFIENFTAYGTFRPVTGDTWQTIDIDTWQDWNEPWNAGSSTLVQPKVIGGNQQGFVFLRETFVTQEPESLYIQSFSGNTVTSPNHCLNESDYIIITGCLGTIGAQVNGIIFQVSGVGTNTFVIDNPNITGTYFGGGVITRMYIPLIQTKEFPMAWNMARKTRIGPQMYLLSATDDAQITLQIYLSQDSSSPYNFGNVVPNNNVQNNSLVYTDVLYTCPESTNLGLTPANTNLQMPTAATQGQIWHRINTSLLGDTVQLGFTLSDAQMRAVDSDGNTISQFSEMELHAIVIDVNPSQMLA